MTATEGYCKILLAIIGEEAIEAHLETMSKEEYSGTIGGWFRLDSGDNKGIYSQKTATFSYFEDDGAFALSMASALVTAAALAF